MPEAAPLDDSRLLTAAWANYVGMSWTWCIGMFFPVLLVRDFGFWGWLVFAFPNVVGSMIFGGVVGTAGRSRAIVQQHTPMMAVFSIVTIAFHVFFVGWKIAPLMGLWPTLVLIAATTLLLVLTQRGRRSDLFAAAGVLAVSIAAIAVSLTQPLGDENLLRRADPSFALLGLAPVCMLGFFLCPYLDLTYHHARQATTPLAGARAFRIGFAGPFFVMIVFTLLYARWLDRWEYNRILAFAIGTHLTVQTVFTVWLHSRATFNATKNTFRVGRWLLLAAVAVSMALVVFIYRVFILRHLDSGEVIYLCFMGFYACLFPTYVWTRLVPGPSTLRAQIASITLCTAMAVACNWMAFIEHDYAWLAGGVAAVLIARPLARWMSSRERFASDSARSIQP